MFGASNKKYENLDDSILLARFKQTNDLEVLGALYHRYMHLVYGISLKYYKDPEESKDAVMQIFEKLVETVPKQEISNFKPWLYVVTKNHCLMRLRSKQKVDSQTLFMEIQHVQHLNGEETNEHEVLIGKAVKNLPDKQRQCVEMFYYQSLSYQEIAEETGFQLKKVKSYIQNGKRNLKIYLDKNER